jgi:predicted ATPase/DNA-binding SARP family transcriptional activator
VSSVEEGVEASRLEFGILGPLQVLRAGNEVNLGTPKQRAVLALLLLEAGRVVSTGRLIEELWQGRPPPSADATLRSYVSRLRALLRPDATLRARSGGYVLDTAALQLDADHFQELVREGDDALEHGLARTAAERLRRALSLWRGRALADVAEDGLLALESGRLEELRLSAVERRIEAELALGLHSEVVGELERLIDEHPMRERLWRQLMLALYRCDRQADALAAYGRLREILATELGLEPGEEVRLLHLAVLRHEVPAARRAGGQHNLPAPLSSFIGRERELDDVDDLLTEARLVTVTGVGGVGKTRLAVAAATRSLARFGRVCFVDLSGVGDSDGVARAAAEALAISEHPHRRLIDVLADALRANELLLVLDNCEHVRDGSAELVQGLLETVPALHVLATSREPLRVSGEIDYSLSPLPVPGDDRGTDDLTRFASVRLFLERASASRADFAATDGTIATVARICRDLDGLPLAIELAAVRARSLSPEEIALHLDRRFDFLTFWRRVAVPRHQTLRATMDWSYELLSEQEQHTLRRLSVFTGGFSAATSAPVCTGGDEAQAVDLLGRLVERSLVVAIPNAAGTRYRLLETVRQYAAERLAGAGEEGRARRAHAEAFLRLAREASSQGKDGLDLLAREQGNLRAALEWSFGSEDEIAVLLTRALGRFWLARWQLAEGRAWVERALALHRGADGMRAELLGFLGGILFEIGDLTEAERILADAVRIADVTGDTVLGARLSVRRADARLMLGAISEREALAESEAAAATLEARGDTEGLADALTVMGKLEFWLREPSSQETLERAAALGRASGNRPAELLAVEWLAVTFHDLTVPTDVAIERQERLLAAVTGESRAEAGVLATLAWTYGFAGRFAEARLALARSRAIYSADFGWTLDWAGCAMNAGAVELMAGDPAAAERALRPAYDALHAMREANYVVDTAYYLTISLCEQGRDDDALQVVDDTRSVLPPGHDLLEGEWALAAARVWARRGQFETAVRLANDGRRRLGASPRWLGQALLTQGDVLELAGKLEESAGVYAEALALYEDRRAAPMAELARTAFRRLSDRLARTGGPGTGARLGRTR